MTLQAQLAYMKEQAAAQSNINNTLNASVAQGNPNNGKPPCSSSSSSSSTSTLCDHDLQKWFLQQGENNNQNYNMGMQFHPPNVQSNNNNIISLATQHDDDEWYGNHHNNSSSNCVMDIPNPIINGNYEKYNSSGGGGGMEMEESMSFQEETCNNYSISYEMMQSGGSSRQYWGFHHEVDDLDQSVAFGYTGIGSSAS